MKKSDDALEALLDLDGEIIILNQQYWVKFEAKRLPDNDHRPHGIKYSLTLHDDENERVIGYDNAHKIPNSTLVEYDHRHLKSGRIKPYTFETAHKLLEDFWKDVDKYMSGK